MTEMEFGLLLLLALLGTCLLGLYLVGDYNPFDDDDDFHDHP